ncbi:MAG: MAPEG family protein [Novosphingobium sp.]
MILPITTLAVGVAAAMLIALSVLVSLRRARLGVEIGDPGEDVTLTRRIRAQGNFSEYVPLALLLIALVEASTKNLHAAIALAVVLLMARLAHAAGTLIGVAWLRGIGLLATFVTLFGGIAVLAIGYALSAPLK